MAKSPSNVDPATGRPTGSEDDSPPAAAPARQSPTPGPEALQNNLDDTASPVQGGALAPGVEDSFISEAPNEDLYTVQPVTIPDSLIDPRLRDASHTEQDERSDTATDASEVAGTVPDVPGFSTPSHSRSSVTPLRLLGTCDTAFLATPSSSDRSLTPSSNFSSSPFSSPSKPARQRPTKANPCFGEVVGVYRGSKLLTVRRTRHRREEKKKQNPSHDDAGVNIPKVFYDRTRRFMTKLEDLAEDTGAWVHFSAQHPTANEPFIHFTSRRLRTEGGDLLDGLHQANHQLYTSLMSARRCDTTQLAAKLAHANEELARVNAEAEAKIVEAKKVAAAEAESKLAEAHAAKEAAEKDFQRIRAALSLAGIVIPGLTTDKA
ncbi:hypothetical protein VNI00_019315 [Paramarasmius palmivorus]|uniref:Uncharacterized protein n=1 Tax=Paramarasmius palmivorus TaxID=297713 RepID=A0AAW0AN95_9AGAR